MYLLCSIQSREIEITELVAPTVCYFVYLVCAHIKRHIHPLAKEGDTVSKTAWCQYVHSKAICPYGSSLMRMLRRISGRSGGNCDHFCIRTRRMQCLPCNANRRRWYPIGCAIVNLRPIEGCHFSTDWNVALVAITTARASSSAFSNRNILYEPPMRQSLSTKYWIVVMGSVRCGITRN